MVRAKKSLDVIIDVVIRWLSTLYMVRCALLFSALRLVLTFVGDRYSDWFRDVHKSDQNTLDPLSYWYERRKVYPRLS